MTWNMFSDHLWSFISMYNNATKPKKNPRKTEQSISTTEEDTTKLNHNNQNSTSEAKHYKSYVSDEVTVACSKLKKDNFAKKSFQFEGGSRKLACVSFALIQTSRLPKSSML